MQALSRVHRFPVGGLISDKTQWERMLTDDPRGTRSHRDLDLGLLNTCDIGLTHLVDKKADALRLLGTIKRRIHELESRRMLGESAKPLKSLHDAIQSQNVGLLDDCVKNLKSMATSVAVKTPSQIRSSKERLGKLMGAPRALLGWLLLRNSMAHWALQDMSPNGTASSSSVHKHRFILAAGMARLGPTQSCSACLLFDSV